MMLKIPHQDLEPQTLTSLIEDFVTRDGTDYGAAEVSLAAKVSQVRHQLDRGEAVITFDEETGSCALRARHELNK